MDTLSSKTFGMQYCEQGSWQKGSVAPGPGWELGWGGQNWVPPSTLYVWWGGSYDFVPAQAKAVSGPDCEDRNRDPSVEALCYAASGNDLAPCLLTLPLKLLTY